MQDKILGALRSKYRTPQAAMRAWGLDENLLRDGEDMQPKLNKVARAGVEALIAQDASIAELTEFLKALASTEGAGAPAESPVEEEEAEELPMEESVEEAPGEDEQAMPATEPNSAPPMAGKEEEPVANDNETAQRLFEILSRKLDPKEMEEVGQLLAEIAGPPAPEAKEGPETPVPAPEGQEPAKPESPAPEAPEAPEKKPAEDCTAEDEDETEEEKKDMKLPAMDAALATIEKRVRQVEREIRAAEREIRPYVGELAMDADSASDVYRFGLKALGAEGIDGIKDAGALASLFRAYPKPSSSAPRKAVAMDAASNDSFFKMFPDAARIGRV